MSYKTWKKLLLWDRKNSKVGCQLPRATKMAEILEIEDTAPSLLLPCTTCNRTFRPETLAKHAKVCEKSLMKKRKKFDSAKQRIQGTELAQFLPTAGAAGKKPAVKTEPQSKWKEKDKGAGESVRPVKKPIIRKPEKTLPSKQSDHEQCPHCERNFGPKAFDRHVEWCKEQSTRMRTRSQSSLVAKERLQARTKYRAPLSKTQRALTKEHYSPLRGQRDASPQVSHHSSPFLPHKSPSAEPHKEAFNHPPTLTRSLTQRSGSKFNIPVRTGSQRSSGTKSSRPPSNASDSRPQLEQEDTPNKSFVSSRPKVVNRGNTTEKRPPDTSKPPRPPNPSPPVKRKSQPPTRKSQQAPQTDNLKLNSPSINRDIQGMLVKPYTHHGDETEKEIGQKHLVTKLPENKVGFIRKSPRVNIKGQLDKKIDVKDHRLQRATELTVDNEDEGFCVIDLNSDSSPEVCVLEKSRQFLTNNELNENGNEHLPQEVLEMNDSINAARRILEEEGNVLTNEKQQFKDDVLMNMNAQCDSDPNKACIILESCTIKKEKVEELDYSTKDNSLIKVEELEFEEPGDRILTQNKFDSASNGVSILSCESSLIGRKDVLGLNDDINETTLAKDDAHELKDYGISQSIYDSTQEKTCVTDTMESEKELTDIGNKTMSTSVEVGKLKGSWRDRIQTQLDEKAAILVPEVNLKDIASMECFSEDSLDDSPESFDTSLHRSSTAESPVSADSGDVLEIEHSEKTEMDICPETILFSQAANENIDHGKDTSVSSVLRYTITANSFECNESQILIKGGLDVTKEQDDYSSYSENKNNPTSENSSCPLDFKNDSEVETDPKFKSSSGNETDEGEYTLNVETKHVENEEIVILNREIEQTTYGDNLGDKFYPLIDEDTISLHSTPSVQGEIDDRLCSTVEECHKSELSKKPDLVKAIEEEEMLNLKPKQEIELAIDNLEDIFYPLNEENDDTDLSDHDFESTQCPEDKIVPKFDLCIIERKNNENEQNNREITTKFRFSNDDRGDSENLLCAETEEVESGVLSNDLKWKMKCNPKDMEYELYPSDEEHIGTSNRSTKSSQDEINPILQHIDVKNEVLGSILNKGTKDVAKEGETKVLNKECEQNSEHGVDHPPKLMLSECSYEINTSDMQLENDLKCDIMEQVIEPNEHQSHFDIEDHVIESINCKNGDVFKCQSGSYSDRDIDMNCESINGTLGQTRVLSKENEIEHRKPRHNTNLYYDYDSNVFNLHSDENGIKINPQDEFIGEDIHWDENVTFELNLQSEQFENPQIQLSCGDNVQNQFECFSDEKCGETPTMNRINSFQFNFENNSQNEPQIQSSTIYQENLQNKFEHISSKTSVRSPRLKENSSFQFNLVNDQLHKEPQFQSSQSHRTLNQFGDFSNGKSNDIHQFSGTHEMSDSSSNEAQKDRMYSEEGFPCKLDSQFGENEELKEQLDRSLNFKENSSFQFNLTSDQLHKEPQIQSSPRNQDSSQNKFEYFSSKTSVRSPRLKENSSFQFNLVNDQLHKEPQFQSSQSHRTQNQFGDFSNGKSNDIHQFSGTHEMSDSSSNEAQKDRMYSEEGFPCKLDSQFGENEELKEQLFDTNCTPNSRGKPCLQREKVFNISPQTWYSPPPSEKKTEDIHHNREEQSLSSWCSEEEDRFFEEFQHNQEEKQQQKVDQQWGSNQKQVRKFQMKSGSREYICYESIEYATESQNNHSAVLTSVHKLPDIRGFKNRPDKTLNEEKQRKKQRNHRNDRQKNYCSRRCFHGELNNNCNCGGYYYQPCDQQGQNPYCHKQQKGSSNRTKQYSNEDLDPSCEKHFNYKKNNIPREMDQSETTEIHRKRRDCTQSPLESSYQNSNLFGSPNQHPGFYHPAENKPGRRPANQSNNCLNEGDSNIYQTDTKQRNRSNSYSPYSNQSTVRNRQYTDGRRCGDVIYVAMTQSELDGYLSPYQPPHQRSPKTYRLPPIQMEISSEWTSFPHIVRHVITTVLPKRFSVNDLDKYDPYVSAELQMLELFSEENKKNNNNNNNLNQQEETVNRQTLPILDSSPVIIRSSPASAFAKFSPISPVRSPPPDNLSNEIGSENGNNSRRGSNMSLSNLSLCSVISIDSIDCNRNSKQTLRSQSALDPVKPIGVRHVPKIKPDMHQMLYGSSPFVPVENEKNKTLSSTTSSKEDLEACEAELLISMMEFEKMLNTSSPLPVHSSSPPVLHLESSPTLCSSAQPTDTIGDKRISPSNNNEEDIEIKRPSAQVHNVDSAYSSLTRKTPVESGGVVDSSQPEYAGSSKFCHECGARYPIPAAKFCCQCGIRRLTI